LDREQLLWELQSVNLNMYRRLSQEWAKHIEKGISSPQVIILDLLNAKGKLKASDLAEALNITSGAVTGLCDKLIQYGYAKRSRTEEDRRVVYLEITDDGRDMLKNVAEKRKRITEKFYGRLPEDDLRHLIRIHRQVLQNIELEKE